MNWDTHKKQLSKDPEFVKALKAHEVEYHIARSIIQARMNMGITQAELAKKLNTKQSVISRVENAKTTPSISFLKRLATALDTPLHIHLG